LVVVAEGVETEGQLEVLAALDCDRIQGFLLAPPGEPAAVAELVGSRASPAFRSRAR
jgi:EAL domain-containing protein (putative c-di-GMP-specific phosphodiesterase class I)